MALFPLTALLFPMTTTLIAAHPVLHGTAPTIIGNIARDMARDNPFATFTDMAQHPHPKHWVGGCYNAPTPDQMLASARNAPFVFTEQELQEAREVG